MRMVKYIELVRGNKASVVKMMEKLREITAGRHFHSDIS